MLRILVSFALNAFDFYHCKYLCTCRTGSDNVCEDHTVLLPPSQSKYKAHEWPTNFAPKCIPDGKYLSLLLLDLLRVFDDYDDDVRYGRKRLLVNFLSCKALIYVNMKTSMDLAGALLMYTP